MSKKDVIVNFKNMNINIRIQENGRSLSLIEIKREIAGCWNIPYANLNSIELLHFGTPVTDEIVNKIVDEDPVVVIYNHHFFETTGCLII